MTATISKNKRTYKQNQFILLCILPVRRAMRLNCKLNKKHGKQMEGKNVMCKLAREQKKIDGTILFRQKITKKNREKQKARAKIEFDCIHLW